MTEDKPRYNVLFLCTGNSARSILAECLVNELGAGKFRGYSAGSKPRGEVHPLAIYELRKRGYNTRGLCSKNWEVFTAPDAPVMDFVFTVCDNAANESCPLWPGQPMTAHWGMADPAAVEGDDITCKRAFVTAFNELQSRISIFVNLPIEALDSLRLQEKLDEIGHIDTSAPQERVT